MTRRLAPLLAPLLAAGALVLAGCGEEAEGPPLVAASTGVIADLAATVAADDAEVRQIIPDSASPHAFTLSARDRAEIEDASLLVLAGGGLEAGVPIDGIDAPRWELLDEIPRPLAFEGEPGSDSDALDPHAWLDPARVAAAVPSLAAALGEVDPGHAGAYERRGRALQRELEQLDAELAGTFRRLEPAERRLVSSHDSLGYLADRYGLEVLISPFGATGPEGVVSAARLQEVIDAVRRSGVASIYAQPTDSREVLEQIATETGVEVREGLLVESLGPAAGYAEMLRHDAELIAGG